ncbi:MAG: bifunctional phosphopantothenoylcysteine decarboxylase/phosphopantothenate synthase [Nocardioidaceae bacterium]|nr:bifunctional phosphopantothenoylcysteine decarboxylase/phosphopantothenate synthase [Nocardioidaceae bacterium]
MSSAQPPHVVLGVSGGIAAYKACELLRLFTESGHDVTVVPTAAALKFVGAVTWEALSGKPVSSDVFSQVPGVQHVRLGREADLVVVAPATADLLAKAAHGFADDLLTSTLLTATCPIIFVPAMHTEMWEHAATQHNVETLRSRGSIVMEPAYGRLTGVDTGLGRLPEPVQILEFAGNVLRSTAVRPDPEFEADSALAAAGWRGSVRHDLSGRRVVISAGGTREPFDPVRFLGNRSSGKQGFALAAAAVARNADVCLVAANVSLPTPYGVSERVDVTTTEELRRAVTVHADSAHAVVMAAAPADFRPATVLDHKIKKDPDHPAPTIDLVENPDILAELVATRDRRPLEQILVGFAAETGDARGSVLEHARDKLAHKGCDLLVVNDVSGGRVFGADDNQAVILGRHGFEREFARGSKADLAHAIWDEVSSLWVTR